MSDLNGFFAYAGEPVSRAETVREAIKQINQRVEGLINIRGWESFDVTGKPIIHEVCAAINECDLFICDLTKMSPNVLFELGYAIAKDKRVWITLNTTYQQVRKNYEKLSLSTVGYTPSSHSFELTNRFLEDEPYNDLESTIFRDMIQSIVQSQKESPHLLYLKSEVSTEASVRLTRRLQKLDAPLVTDDPDEVPTQPLSWYALKSYYAFGVVTHLIDEAREPNVDSLRNAKYSLVSGLAYGFDKQILLLAHAPFSSPVDYRDLLKVHKTAQKCISITNPWLSKIEKYYLESSEEYKKTQSEVEAAVGLQKIRLGEYVAENEHRELTDYFVSTAAFREALNTHQYEIYVGRKGSGKTANLYQLAHELSKDKRNHVFIIKPIDYELEGVVRLLTSSLSQADPGYLIESLWKFLIYTELAWNVYEQIKGKPSYLPFNETDTEFLEYVESNREVFSEFTVRMEHAIMDLCDMEPQDSVQEHRVKVSEILHTNLLSDLRVLLGKVLEDKNKVFVLIDNLDKAWKKRKDLDVLSQFLFGLLSAGQAISKDFQKDRPKWPSVNLALVIFLRSDIFSHIKRVAREKDKVAFTRINWNDPVLLNRVIEERFANSLEESIDARTIWPRFFADKVKGMSPEDYIQSRIIPRPRDIIFFCRSALAHAINRKHTRIEKDDILQAENEYSEYAFDTLLAETETQFEPIEALLYEFVGANEIVTQEHIAEFVDSAGIPNGKTNYVVDLLFEAMFLGLETQPNNFEFLYEPNRKKVLQKLAQKTAEEKGQKRFKINTPFHSFLEIRSSS
jgi:hypothetical protein